MPTEERPEEVPRAESRTREHYFDELTKELASGTISRGKALRFVGAALLGGALGIVGLAQPALARRQRSGCTPCDRSFPPPGKCCLTFGGSTQGCVVDSQQTCQRIFASGICTRFGGCSCTGEC